MSSYIIKSELKLPKTGYHSVISFIIDRLKAWHEDIILVSNYSNKSIQNCIKECFSELKENKV
jgi:hypothetical protein